MILLIILGIILLLLIASLFIRIRFDISANDEISVKLNILGIKFSLYPQNKKEPNPKKFKKGYPKEKKRKEKAQEPVITAKAESIEKIPIGDKVSTIISLIKKFCTRFFKHLRLDISKIIIIVGAEDAAKCAVSYGIISQSVAYLLEFLDHNLNISKKRGGEIDVLCDFTAESISYDVFISASITTWQILDIAITLAYNYFKGKDIFNIKKSLSGGHKSNGGKQDQ